MTQTYTDNCFQSGNVGQTDLQNIENNFAAVKSNFSGTSAPPNAVPGMLWFDTDADTNNKGVQKLYNNDGDWFGLLYGNSTHIMLVYRNTAIDGWAVSSAVTDKVVAIKGGSTYTTGGATAGSWTISGISTNNESSHTHNHNHKSYNNTTSGAHDNAWDSGGNTNDLGQETQKALAAFHLACSNSTGDYPVHDLWTNNDNTSGSAHSHGTSHTGTWRVAAAVCTMQYIDI